MSAIPPDARCQRILSEIREKDPELYKQLSEDPSMSSDPLKLQLVQIILKQHEITESGLGEVRSKLKKIQSSLGGSSEKDFYPHTHWEKSVEKNSRGIPKYLIDRRTGEKYDNKSKGEIAETCKILAQATIPFHLVAGTLNVAYRSLKLISFSHFWRSKKGEEPYNFKARRQDACKDFLRIVKQPFAIAALQCAAVHGIWQPYDGRALYAKLERGLYGRSILAPFFQPKS